MRILVIGGTGFIGRFLVPLLQEGGHHLAVFHRRPSGTELPPGVESLTGDRHTLPAHAADLRGFRPDLVIDMIASSGAHGRTLMEVFRGHARRVVVLSSMDAYRAVAVLHGLDSGPLEPLPLTEESPLRQEGPTYPPEQVRALQPVFPWLDEGYDKVAVERAVVGDRELPATVLRLPMVYGPGDPLHRFHPLLRRMAAGRKAIPFDERMARWRGSRGYVENVAAAVALAAGDERAAGRVYNVAEEEALTELEWGEQVARAAAWDGRFVVLPAGRAPAHLVMPGNLEQHWVADPSRIRAELGYRERVPRTEAVRRTVEWERANPPAQSPPPDYAAEDAAMAGRY